MKTLHHALILAGFLVSLVARAGAQTVNLTATDSSIADRRHGHGRHGLHGAAAHGDHSRRS